MQNARWYYTVFAFAIILGFSQLWATKAAAAADTVAPSVDSFILTANNTLNIKVSALTASDNVGVTGYMVTNSSNTPPASSPVWNALPPTSVIVSAGGSYTFYGWARDAAGNVSLGKSASVIVNVPDTTAPMLTVFNLPATATSLNIPVLSLSALDNVAVTGYMITSSATPPLAADGGWTATAPASITAPAAGSYTFYAWARDAAGNVSRMRSGSVTVDINMAPPVIILSTLSDLAITANKVLNLAGSVTDINGVAAFTINGVNLLGEAAGFSHAIELVHGANVITVNASDTLNNTTSITRTIIYDPAAPAFTVTSPADLSRTGAVTTLVTGTVASGNTVHIEVIDADSGTVSDAREAVVTGAGFSASMGLTNPLNTIEVTVTGPANGATSRLKRTLAYDPAVPSLAITSPAADSLSSNGTIALAGTFGNAVEPLTIQIAKDGVNFAAATSISGDGTSPSSFSGNVELTEAGSWPITVRAVKLSDNSVVAQVKRNIIYTIVDPATITAAAAPNGSISPSGAAALNKGANRTYTITPHPGFKVDVLVVDGTMLPGATSYTFSNVTTDHYINAYFAPSTCAVTAGAAANGSISPAGVVTVTPGSNKTYTITPDPGFKVALLVVDGAVMPAAATHTFNNISGDHYINAYFAPSELNITAGAAANGSISPGGVTTVTPGSSRTYIITPDPGFMVTALVVDGAILPGATGYTFTDISASHYLNAYFGPLPATVTITAGAAANGSISAAGATAVANGSNQTYTITPAPGYTVAALVVDGTVLPGATSYTFSNVTTDHYINAYFQ